MTSLKEKTSLTNDLAKGLLKELKKADDVYYNSSKKESSLTDERYDKKKDSLISLVKRVTDKELKTKVKKYLKTVGAKVRKSKRDTVLPFMVGSLNKVTKDKQQKINTLKKYLPKADYLCGPKADGTSITLKYEQHGLSNAFSRGDGKVGQSKIEHIKNIKGIANKLDKDLPAIVYIRGEAVLDKKAFEKKFKNVSIDGKTYKEARNACSGWINSDDSDSAISTIANFIPHELLDENGLPIETKKIRCKYDAVKYLNSIFKVPYTVKQIKTYDGLIELLESSLEENKELFYETDGTVLEINSYLVRNAINKGNTTKYPKYAIAYKQSAKDAAKAGGVESKVTDISISVNKSGMLFPTINFKSVLIGNSNVSKASGKSFKHICESGFEKGTKIVVVKAGGVIPEVYLKDKPNSIKPIKYCLCGAKATKIEGGAGAWTLYCSKPHKCKFVKRAQLEATLKRLKLTGLGAVNINKLFEAGYTDLFELVTAKDKDIYNIEGFGISILTTIKKGILEKLATFDKATLMDCSGVFIKTGLSLAENSLQKILNKEITEGERYDLYKEKLSEFKKWDQQIKDLVKESKYKF